MLQYEDFSLRPILWAGLKVAFDRSSSKRWELERSRGILIIPDMATIWQHSLLFTIGRDLRYTHKIRTYCSLHVHNSNAVRHTGINSIHYITYFTDTLLASNTIHSDNIIVQYLLRSRHDLDFLFSGIEDTTWEKILSGSCYPKVYLRQNWNWKYDSGNIIRKFLRGMELLFIPHWFESSIINISCHSSICKGEAPRVISTA